MFGPAGTGSKTDQEPLYEDFSLTVACGEIVVVLGPSGAGKTALLRAIHQDLGPEAIALELEALARSDLPAVACLADAGGPGRDPGRPDLPGLSRRLEILSRCGLAEAAVLVCPARCLSGGQQYRLALAAAIWRARRPPARRPKPQARTRLLLVDEFAATLDLATAQVLAHQVSKLVRRYGLGMILATARQELLAALSPARIIVKPLGGPAVTLPVGSAALERSFPAGGTGAEAPRRVPGGSSPEAGGHIPVWPCEGACGGSRRRFGACWPIQRGHIADYHHLGRFHYLAGPPAAHKRVWLIRVPETDRQPGAPEMAAVLVVSPPVLNCRGRNVATDGRYLHSKRAGRSRPACIRRLNAEIECISRVIVHPIYRGCGLAVRLVRHALATAETPLVEALATMGAVHPFLELAGMTCYGRFAGRARPYSYYLAARQNHARHPALTVAEGNVP